MDPGADLIPAWIDGRLTPVDKLEVHRLGLRHPAVSVFILCGDRLLIQRRAAVKYHSAGQWANTCCTHPRWGEDAHACAVRRLPEELGLAAPELIHRAQIEYSADVGCGLTEHELVEVFVGTVETQPPLAPEPDEVSDVRWVRLGDLAREIREAPERFTPWLRIYLERNSGQIFDAVAFSPVGPGRGPVSIQSGSTSP